MESSMIETTSSYLARVIAETEDCFAEAQRAAKLRDWRAFRRLMNQHAALCQQWEQLVT